MHSLIVARALSFEFPDGRALFHDLNFSLDSGPTALVGPNGAGKSTLARLLTGELEPSTGSVLRRSGVRYLPQREEPPPDLARLSGGEWMRERLARALGDGYLILDEPTNDLDREGRRWVLDFLRRHRGGALLISHDREALSLCENVLELSSQGLMKFGGGWRDYQAAKEAERAALNRALETAKRERGRINEARHEQLARQEKRNRAGAAKAARGGMPKILTGGRKRRAQGTTGKIDAATAARAGRAVTEAHEALAALKSDPVMYAGLLGEGIPAQRLVAEARDFNIKFGRWLFAENLNFEWRGNIRLALTGANGSGKSTLLAALLGARFDSRGELRSGGLRTLFIDQQGSSLNEEKSVFENVREAACLDESEIRNGLAKFLFTKDTVFQKVRTLSGGERLRAALARGFLGTEKPELMILDEPTNNLDLANVEFLENLAREFRGALIVVSHDEVFLERCGIGQSFGLGGASLDN